MGIEESRVVLIFVVSAAIIVVLAVLVALFVVVYQKRIVAQDIRLKKLESAYQQELLQATIEGQERERRRLAKDLHDGIGSLLWGLKLNLKSQQGKGGEDPNVLDEVFTMLDEGIVDVRRVSHNLLPHTLENFGLIQALDEWIEPFQKPGGFSIRLQVEGSVERLEVAVELGLFRVVQELLQNTIRHAKAKEALLSFTFKPTNIKLHYTDNGIGLAAGKKPHGIGIKNMQSRVLALEGTIRFGEEGNPGFSVNIDVPI